MNCNSDWLAYSVSNWFALAKYRSDLLILDRPVAAGRYLKFKLNQSIFVNGCWWREMSVYFSSFSLIVTVNKHFKCLKQHRVHSSYCEYIL